MQNSFQQFFAKALVGASAVVTVAALLLGAGGQATIPAKPSTLLELGMVFLLAAIYFALDEMRMSK
jgi:hypothetical protein